ncbi:MAG: hypothetical protein ACREKE_08765 [bacterium]
MSEIPAARPKRVGLALFLAGVACEGLGFLILAHGSMDLAPALLVGSFGVMAWGIWLGW